MRHVRRVVQCNPLRFLNEVEEGLHRLRRRIFRPIYHQGRHFDLRQRRYCGPVPNGARRCKRVWTETTFRRLNTSNFNEFT